jgi:hypothetical protein
MMKGGIFNFATLKPCQSPTRLARIKTIMMERGMLNAGIEPTPLTINVADITPVRAVIDPTERSIPPVIMTNSSPMANSPKVATKRMMTARLAGFRKVSGLFQ